MRLKSIIRLRHRSLFSRSGVERELDEELQYHLDREIEENIVRGIPPREARRAALRAVHGFEQRKEECRDMRGLNLIDNMTQDVRFAIRQLRKNPGFTTTAVLMLALGLCASVAIFAFVDAALLQPLPYQNPNRIVAVYETTTGCPQCNASLLNFRDWQKSATFFRSLDAWGYSSWLLRGAEGVEPVPGVRVTDGFFRTLGVKPTLGRDFYTGEDAPGHARTVLISYAAWQIRFGGRRDVLGQVVTLSEIPFTIVGVLPKEFQFALRGRADFWATLNSPNSLGACEQRRGCHNLFALGRLGDGVSQQRALAGMKAIAGQLEKQYPDDRGFSADLIPLSEAASGNIRPILLVLLGGAALLLLIACINVASLLVVRTESRRREIAVRGALGASRARMARQFITEGLVLVSAGSILGLFLGSQTIHLLASLVPAEQIDSMPFLLHLGLNERVLGFAGAVTLLAAMLFALTPAMHFSSSSKMTEGLAEGSRGSAGMLWRRLGSRLVVLELATAVVLLTGAGLLGKSLYRLLQVDTGLRTDHLATLLVTLPKNGLTDERLMSLEQRIVANAGSIPGATSAGITTSRPFSSWSLASNIAIPGRPAKEAHSTVSERDVSSAYLTTLGAKLVRGRYFTEAEDDPEKPRVVVVNQTFVRRFFPGQDAVGRQFTYEKSQVRIEIIGVVDDVKEGQLDEENHATIYVPFTQDYFATFTLVVRTQVSDQNVLPALTAAMHRIDPGIATSEPATMSQVLDQSRSAWLHRSSAWVVGGFAAVALVLCVVGLYGVVAYSVSQRTREVGIRMALGADGGIVYRLILKEAVWLTAGGLVLGLVCSVGAARLMAGMLFGVQSWDVPTLGSVAGVLGIAALLASYIPARRAVSVNPLDALRTE